MAAFPSVVIILLSCSYLHSSIVQRPFEMVTRYIHTVCNDTMDLPLTRLLDGNAYNWGEPETSNVYCIVSIQVKSHHSVILSLQSAGSVESGLFCPNNSSGDRIFFATPTSLLQSQVEGIDSCDDLTTKHSLVSTNRKLSVHFYRNNTEEYHARFLLLLIPFHTGSCQSDERECINGRCIESSMYCQSNYNSCYYGGCRDVDDRPDPITCPNPYPEIIVTIMIFAAIAIICVIVGCCCFCRKRQRQRWQHLRNNRELRSSQTGNSSSTGETLPPMSVITAPAYTPPCDPPPYTTQPDTH